MKSASILLLAIATLGCAGSPTGQNPTHQWATESQVSAIQYRNDHARCQNSANLAADRNLDPASAEFSAYKACMETRGYTLTASAQ